MADISPIMLFRPLIMLALPLLLFLLPVKVNYRQLVILAFGLWATGGFILANRGLNFLTALNMETVPLILGIMAAVLIGFAKGKFILSKSSLRNVKRLQEMEFPQKLIAVYPLRSWILIGIMVGISLSLSLFGMDEYWRGLINLGIGMALLASSTLYLRYLDEPAPILPGSVDKDSSTENLDA